MHLIYVYKGNDQIIEAFQILNLFSTPNVLLNLFELFQYENHDQLIGVHYSNGASSLDSSSSSVMQSVSDVQGHLWLSAKYQNAILPQAWSVQGQHLQFQDAKQGQCVMEYDRLG